MKDIINKIFDGETLFAFGVIAIVLTLLTKANSCLREEQSQKHEREMGQQRLEQLKLEALKGCGKLWA